MSSFMDKVQAVENKFMDLEQQISDPSVIARQDEWQKLTKEHASLMPIVETFRKYKDITSTIDGDKEIIDDPDSDDDLIAMAKEEMNGLTKEQADLEDQLHVLMLPKDPRDDKNVIMEIRAGAGGDEAALFAGDLFRMYMKYIEKQPGWKTSIISSNAPELGGFKEVVFSVEGSGVYGKLKYESGVHRVQRVPVTEAGGRIHTSTATVAVLPEAEGLRPRDGGALEGKGGGKLTVIAVSAQGGLFHALQTALSRTNGQFCVIGDHHGGVSAGSGAALLNAVCGLHGGAGDIRLVEVEGDGIVQIGPEGIGIDAFTVCLVRDPAAALHRAKRKQRKIRLPLCQRQVGAGDPQREAEAEHRGQGTQQGGEPEAAVQAEQAACGGDRAGEPAAQTALEDQNCGRIGAVSAEIQQTG